MGPRSTMDAIVNAFKSGDIGEWEIDTTVFMPDGMGWICTVKNAEDCARVDGIKIFRYDEKEVLVDVPFISPEEKNDAFGIHRLKSFVLNLYFMVFPHAIFEYLTSDVQKRGIGESYPLVYNTCGISKPMPYAVRHSYTSAEQALEELIW